MNVRNFGSVAKILALGMGAATLVGSQAALVGTQAVLFGAQAAEIPAAGETWTIASGATETVTESEMTAYNQLAKVVVNGTLVFSEVTTVPAVALEGSGVCQKTGDADWTMSTACPSYMGAWQFGGGLIEPTVNTAFGNTDSRNTDASAVTIASGATLHLTTHHTAAGDPSYFLVWKRFLLAGTGKGGKGAIWIDVNDTTDYYMGPVSLSADATINQPTSGKTIAFNAGAFALNGHRLTLSTVDRLPIKGNAVFAGPGEVELASGTMLELQKVKDVFSASTPRLKLITRGANEIRFIESSRQCPWPAQNADIEVTGTLTLVHSHMSTTSTPVGDFNDLGIVWHGDISLPTSTDKLIPTSDLTAENCLFTFDGTISGAGSVQAFRSSDDGYARVAFEGTNTFTGAMTAAFSQNAGGAVLLGNSNAVPDYAKFSAGQYGRVTLRLDDNGTRWCTNSIARFANAATLSGNTLAFDATKSPDEEATLDVTFWKGVKSGSQPYLVADGGTVGLVGPLSDKYYHFGAVEGALKFTGTEKLCVGESYSFSGRPSGSAGTLLFEDATDVHRGADGSDYGRILLPGQPAFLNTSGLKDSTVGRMVVRNATVVNDKIASNPNENSKYVILVGSGYSNRFFPGVLTVESGADVLDKVLVGSNAKIHGAIYQTGGILRNVGNNDGKTAKLLASSGHAYHELAGGIYEQKGAFMNAYAAGSSYVYVQTGGTYRVTAHAVATANESSYHTGLGDSTLYIGGGLFTNDNNMVFQNVGDSSAGSGKTVLTVDGEGTLVYIGGYLALGRQSNAGTATINLNGGTLNVWYIGPMQAVTECKRYLNANGGTLTMRKATLDVHRITVYEGGFRFDDGGVRYDTFPQITGASGNGVSAIAVPSGLAAKTLVCPPVVTISETGTDGKGFGASAIALFDRKTGKVTGVRITSPGSDYTEATATFSMAGSSWSQVCTLAPNSTAGGFTKKGSSDIFFDKVNTYGGPTVVEGGGLTVTCTGGLPSNTVVRITGGGLGIQKGVKCYFKSIGGTGGYITSADAAGYAIETLTPGTTDAFSFNSQMLLTVTGDTTFDLAEILDDGQTTTYATDIAFGADSTITVANADRLADLPESVKSVTLMTVSGDHGLTGTPAWTNPPADGSWRLCVRGNSLRLVRRHGLILFVR